MISEQEQAAAKYLLDLPPEDREGAAGRINQLVKAQQAPGDSQPKIPIHTLEDYLETDFPVPPFLVSNAELVRGEITATIARAGKGKTTLGMNRLIRWGAGRALFDDMPDSQVPVKPLKLLMIENEGVAAFMQAKLDILRTYGAGLTHDEQLLVNENVLIWGDGGYSGLKIDREEDLELIQRGLEEYRPDAIILEPFRGIWRGDENDATAMEDVLDTLTQLANDYGCGILLAHHENKSGAGDDGEWMSASRGSSVLEGKAAIMENLRSVKAGTYTELSWSKNRFDFRHGPLRMQFDNEKWRLELVPENEVETAILKLMSENPSGWYWINEVASQLDESERKIREIMSHLVETGRVVKKQGTDERRGYRFRLNGGGDNDSAGLGLT